MMKVNAAFQQYLLNVFDAPLVISHLVMMNVLQAGAVQGFQSILENFQLSAGLSKQTAK